MTSLKIALIGLWAAGLVFWVKHVPDPKLHDELIVLSPALLAVSFIIAASCLLWNVKRIAALFSPLTRVEWGGILLIAFMAWIFAHYVAPRTHRIFYDEDIYEEIGLNIAQTNHAAMATDGAWEFGHFINRQMYNNKQPDGWPFVLSLAYRLFGVHENISFDVSNGLFAFAALLLFLCTWLMTESPTIGFAAALLYVLIPENTLWFATVAVEPATTAFSLLAIFCTLVAIRLSSGSAWAMAAGALSLAAQFRSESVFFVVFAGLLVLLLAPRECKKDALHWGFLLLLALLTVHLAHLYSVRNDPWGNSGDKFSLHMFHTLYTNTIYYVNGKRFPVAITLFALIGLLTPGYRKVKNLTFCWFLLTWAIFLFFYAGSYEYGADVRYSLMSMAPFALLAGFGLAAIWAFGRDHWTTKGTAFVVGLLLSIQLLNDLPFMRAVGEEAWMSREDHKAAEYFATLVPDDGIVLTHSAHMFHVWGKSAAQMTALPLHSENSLYQTKYKNRIYLHWNFWCDLHLPEYSDYMMQLLQNYDNTLIAEKTFRGQRFALYQLGDLKKRS